MPSTLGDVIVSTTATPGSADIRSDGTPPTVGVGVSKGEITFQYRKVAKRVEVYFFAGPSAVLDFKVIGANGLQLNAPSFNRPGTYVFVSSSRAIKALRATSNNEAHIERLCFGN